MATKPKKPTEVVVKYHKTAQLWKALESKALAQRHEALAHLTVYFESAVGVGEQPDITKEMYAELHNLHDADARLESLNKWFSEFAAE